jgi:transposase-like protein
MNEFDSVFWVECPNCLNLGKVEKNGEFNFNFEGLNITVDKVFFSCKSCDLTLNNIDKKNHHKEIWRGGFNYELAYGNTCSACGTNNTLVKSNHSENSHHFFNCSGCNSTRKYLVNQIEKDWTKTGIDKYFGFPLKFKKVIKGNLFWIINRPHLLFIKAYLNRNIRKQNTLHNNPENRIPKFIISAKNKHEIIRYIDKIEIELSKIK